MNPALTIAQTLDAHLRKNTRVVVFGTGALLLDPRFEARLAGRLTNDIDLIVPSEQELALEADAQFWDAIEAANRELEPQALYLTHIFPESEVVLTPEWSQHLVRMSRPDFQHLELYRPRMLDLIVTKMGRGDSGDQEDVRVMLKLEPVSYREVAGAADRVRVPEVYREIFPIARDNLLAVVRDYAVRMPGASSPGTDQ